jgi:hypothetical protein
MPVNDTIVSYTNLIKPFGSQDAILAKTLDVATKVIADPAKVAATMADFKDGLDKWQKAEIHPQVLHTPRHATASLLQSHIAQRAILGNKIESFLIRIADKVLEGFEVKFSSDDWPEWAASFFTWVAAIVPATQLPPDPQAAPIDNNFSIGILGDFGTGLYGAPACQQSIESGADNYSLMLHLGDVYYSATPDEVEQRFFRFWPNKAPINRTMNGNHEMYTGGHTYFEMMLPRFNQTASYFAMQNDNWVLIVLDTAYFQSFGGQEGNLDNAQMEWLSAIVQAADRRKVVLFSHHQPFTQLDEDNKGGNLLAQLETYQLADKIFAWFWGHEHRCLMYDPHPTYGFHGRCVGHAAFPESRPDLGNAPISPDFGSQWRQLFAKQAQNEAGDMVPVPGGWVYDNNNLFIPDFATKFAPNGFMRLEFDGDKLVEYVRSPLSANIWIKELTAAD